MKYDQPTNKFELTAEKIRKALVQNITKTVNFVYKKRGFRLTKDQNTKKNVSIQDVANFLIKLEQVMQPNYQFLFCNSHTQFQREASMVLKENQLEI